MFVEQPLASPGSAKHSDKEIVKNLARARILPICAFSYTYRETGFCCNPFGNDWHMNATKHYQCQRWKGQDAELCSYPMQLIIYA